MNDILQVRNLKKTYRDFQISNVSFDIPTNSITGLIGINGAGKTTTIKMILKLIAMETGHVKVSGFDMANEEARSKELIGVVLDNGGLYENLTIDQMKKILSAAYKSWDDTKYNVLTQKFKLVKSQKISTLSRGMHIKVALVFAMSHHAKLLIMDEPTGGLDPLVRDQLMLMLQEYVEEENASVLFSTHITTDLDKIADRIILMNKGKVLWEKEKDDLINQHVIISGPLNLISHLDQSLFMRIKINRIQWRALALSKHVNYKIYSQFQKEVPTIEDIMFAYIDGGCHD